MFLSFSSWRTSQIEKKLGSFSINPTTYIKEFEYLTQSYDLTWHDLYIIVSSTLSPEEKERVWLAAQSQADNLHQQDNQQPVGAVTVPRQDPSWNYQIDSPGHRHQNHMVTCLIAGLQKSAQKAVNYEKLKKISQSPAKNLFLFLSCLTEDLQKCTKLDPYSAVLLFLNPHIISQLAHVIGCKSQRLEDGPQTPQRDLLNIAFKVFNNRDEETRNKKLEKDQAKCQILVAAIQGSRKNKQLPKAEPSRPLL